VWNLGYLIEGAALARAGYYTRQGLITSVSGARRMVDFLERYREMTVILWPPRFFQRALAALLGSSRDKAWGRSAAHG
jgi:hypothetical protein